MIPSSKDGIKTSIITVTFDHFCQLSFDQKWKKIALSGGGRREAPMRIKITKQVTRTIEVTPVQKRKCPTGGKPQQSKIQNNVNIITKNK